LKHIFIKLYFIGDAEEAVEDVTESTKNLSHEQEPILRIFTEEVDQTTQGNHSYSITLQVNAVCYPR
jgi:hypothetical protein